MPPVTYSRKVRRTPQSTAALVKVPRDASVSLSSPSPVGVAVGLGSTPARTSADRLTGSSRVPSV